MTGPNSATAPKGNMARGLEEIVSLVQSSEKFPKSVGVHSWRGRFTFEHVKRISANFPAVFITAVAGDRDRQSGTTYTDTTIVAYVVAKGGAKPTKDALTRFETVEFIIERIFETLSLDTHWRAGANEERIVGMPRGGTWQNSFDKKSDDAGVAIAFMSWTQGIELPGLDFNSLADFDTMVGTWNAEEMVPGANPHRPDPDNFPTGDDTSIQVDY